MSRKNKAGKSNKKRNPIEAKKQNMPKNILDETETTEKLSNEKLYRKIPYQNISYHSFTFWGLSVVSLLALIFLIIGLIQGSLSLKNEVKNLIDFDSAKSEFESRTSIEKSWFKEGISLPDTLLFVNIDRDELIFEANREKIVIAFT